jgi:hypothetical protein
LWSVRHPATTQVSSNICEKDRSGRCEGGGWAAAPASSVRTMIVFQSTLLPYIICGIRNSIKSPFWGRRTFLGGRKEDIQRKFWNRKLQKRKKRKKKKKGKEKSLFWSRTFQEEPTSLREPTKCFRFRNFPHPHLLPHCFFFPPQILSQSWSGYHP